MIFDKNQSAFPSDFHREVWWWAVGIVPPSDSLTDAVRSQCSPDVLEGCYQWHGCFTELSEDMYTHADLYAPASARQYRDILEKIALDGEIRGDTVVWGGEDWQKYLVKLDKSKAYVTRGVRGEDCLRALERVGFRCERGDEIVTFCNVKYPKIFHPMQTMERSPYMRQTPGRHHFAHCEFRQLFKSYSASYDELLRRVSDESLEIAHAIHEFTKTLKIQRYLHFDIIKYKHNAQRVLDFSVMGNEYPTLRVNIGTCAKPGGDVLGDEFYKRLLAADSKTQAVFMKNPPTCDNPDHRHQVIELNGEAVEVCPKAKIQINPFMDDLDAILTLIAARKASIDQNSDSPR